MSEPGTNGTDSARARDGSKKARRDWTAAWLAEFAKTRSVTLACKNVGKGRTTVYAKRGKSKRFAEAWDEIENAMVDDLETSTMHRAVNGWGEPVIWKGRRAIEKDPQTGKDRPIEIRRYDNNLSFRMLQARRPERYRFGMDVNLDAGETAREIRETLRLMIGSVAGPPTTPGDSTQQAKAG